MEKRNFNILIASFIIGISIFWLSAYSFVILDIDPLHNIKKIFGGDDTVVLTIKGNVVEEFELTLSELKSDKYTQVKDKTFHLINAIGREFDTVYSGASLWSILDVENILGAGASTFLFIGADGYYAESPLSLTLAENNPEKIIIAYEQNGEPIFFDGPVMSAIDYSVIPDEITTHFTLKYLKTILIE